MAKRFLIPQKDLRVINPFNKLPLPENGLLVEVDSYWLRRLKDGDVTEIIEKPIEKNTKKKGKNK